jgi:hypothetical protein
MDSPWRQERRLLCSRSGCPAALQTNAKQQYAVSPDGQRFLVNIIRDETATSPITILYNWHPEQGK